MNDFTPPFHRNCFLVKDAKGKEVVHTGLLGMRRVDDEATAQLIVDALNQYYSKESAQHGSDSETRDEATKETADDSLPVSSEGRPQDSSL